MIDCNTLYFIYMKLFLKEYYLLNTLKLDYPCFKSTKFLHIIHLIDGNDDIFNYILSVFIFNALKRIPILRY